MKISFSWLKDWLHLSETPEEVAHILTLAGLEVDKIETSSFGFTGVIIAKVLKAERHPNAERLQIATVFDGHSEHQVVCAATNCRAGLVTAFAPLGSSLKDEKGELFTIQRCKLRGVESFGMLCAEDELGLTAQESPGIMELSPEAPLGLPLAQFLEDTIFEISLTPNLGHCTSHLGVAREIAAFLNRPLTRLSHAVAESDHTLPLDCTIQDFKLSSRYMTRMLEGIRVGPSPSWLVKRLESCGMRSINNVVDVTNYVMLELGQPLHAFDYDRLPEKSLRVAPAEKQYLFKTLDGVERAIPKETLLIVSGDEPVALAGLMGGEASSVHEGTERIVLEAALFDSSTIRKSMKTLGLRSESSGRFEKGVDPNMIPIALDRAAHLLQTICHAQGLKGRHDVKQGAFPKRCISLRVARVNKLLGTQLSENEIRTLLERLLFTLEERNGATAFDVHIPTFRNDIKEEVDLIEEVARLYGYHNIPAGEPQVTLSTLPHSPLYLFERRVRKEMIAQGLQEFLTCDLISPKQAEMGRDPSLGHLIEVLHPSSVDQSILRPSLLAGHLQTVKNNLDYKMGDIAAFEIGAIHLKEGSQYREPHVLGVLFSGKSQPHFSEKSRSFDFYDIKGAIENLLKGLNIQTYKFSPSSLSSFHPNIQAKIEIDTLIIGSLGQVHPKIARDAGLDHPLFFAELNLESLLPFWNDKQMMHPLPLFPNSQRDWTITLKQKAPFGEVLEAIRESSSPYLKEIELLSIYESASLGSDRKNMTLRFTYRNDEATIETALVEKEHGTLMQGVTEKIRAWIV